MAASRPEMRRFMDIGRSWAKVWARDSSITAASLVFGTSVIACAERKIGNVQRVMIDKISAMPRNPPNEITA
jgi:hypothetical protein